MRSVGVIASEFYKRLPVRYWPYLRAASSRRSCRLIFVATLKHRRLQMMRQNALLGLAFILVCMTGCSSSIYGWQVRTSSTAFSPSFDPGTLGQESVGVFG